MTNKPLFHVSFDIPQNRLTTVLEVLTKEVVNLNVTSADARPNNTMNLPRGRGGAREGSGRTIRTKGGSPMTDKTVEWIKAKPSGEEFGPSDVKKFLLTNGFNPGNSSPIMSSIVRDMTIVVSPTKGLYRRR